MNEKSSASTLPSSQRSQVTQSSRTSTGVLSQQSTLVGTQTASSDALRQAVLKFKARLSGKDLTDFQSTTYEQLCHEVLRIQHEQENNKNMMNLSRIQSCLEAMHEFGKTIEVFLNAADMIAFVWGPIKFLLLVRTLNLYTK